MSSDQHEQPVGSDRPLTLLDAIILIAAFACGLGGWLFRQRGMFYRGAAYEPIPVGIFGLSAVALASILTLALCYGVVIASLRPPRPSWCRLSARPGFVACFTAVVTSLVHWAIHAPHVNFANPHLLPNWMTILWFYTLCAFPIHIAPALVSAWLLLKVGGRWDAKTDWIDHLGLVLGGLYLVLAALCWTLPYGV
jgi:hypothetical protein